MLRTKYFALGAIVSALIILLAGSAIAQITPSQQTKKDTTEQFINQMRTMHELKNGKGTFDQMRKLMESRMGKGAFERMSETMANGGGCRQIVNPDSNSKGNLKNTPQRPKTQSQKNYNYGSGFGMMGSRGMMGSFTD